MSTNQIDKIYSIEGYGAIQVSGSQATKLLQGQLSCNVDSISSQQGSLAVHCNPKGRIISLFYICKRGDDFILILPADMINSTVDALAKYAPFYKVDIVDISNQVIIYGTNSSAIEASENICTISLPKQDKRRLVVCADNTKLQANASSNEWHYLNITNNIPRLHPNTSEVFLPHELNLDELNAIDFDKGCFTGQEIIARMHYRGNLKNRMACGTSNKAIEPGSQLFDDMQKQIATVVDICKIPGKSNFILLMTGNQQTLNETTIYSNQGNIINLGLDAIS